MTVGALYQLQQGNVDRMAFLTLNPDITNFKSVYKKYTNFALEYITNYPESKGSSDIDFSYTTKITFKIPRDSDAIRDIYFTFDLPDIYSNSNYQFQWIKRIGEYIVRDVSVRIDTNQNVDKHYAEWFHAYSETTYDEGQKCGYYKMIGNTTELYDPSNAPGNQSIYPSRIPGVSPYAPSIVGRKVYLPLLFWFNKFASMSFPLIAMQYSVMYLDFTLRPLSELYTILDYGGTGYRIRPNNTSSNYIGNFLLQQDTTIKTININPKLEINNIFLDREERKRFGLATHEYLITQLQLVSQPSAVNGEIKIDLKNFNKPVKEIVFMVRRTDLELANQWSNYTNWNLENIPPYSVGYINPNGPTLTITSTNIQSYKTDYLVKSAYLSIENNIMTDGTVINFDNPVQTLVGKDAKFYNLIQNFAYNRNVPADVGIYTYSFSFDNYSLQPSGAINMSSIINKALSLNLTNISNTGYNGSSYGYNIYVFAVNYDILKIMGGLVGTMTSN